MRFFIRLTDDPARSPLRESVAEDHWRYFDDHADHVIAHGATRAEDGKTFIASVLFVDFPDWAAVESFVAAEPLNRAGLFASVAIQRWTSALGRRQKDYARRPDLTPFLIHGLAKPGTSAARDALLEDHKRYFAAYDAAHFIVRGGLWDDRGEDWLGSALLICLEDRGAAEAFVAGEPYSRAGLYDSQIIESYVFGGRPVR